MARFCVCINGACDFVSPKSGIHAAPTLMASVNQYEHTTRIILVANGRTLKKKIVTMVFGKNIFFEISQAKKRGGGRMGEACLRKQYPKLEQSNIEQK